MPWQNDLRLQLPGAPNGFIKILDFKPQKYAISVREFRIADRTVMMLHVPTVQLKNQPAVRDKPLILRTAVITFAAEETLIPTTARLNIAHADQRLWVHRCLPSQSSDPFGLSGWISPSLAVHPHPA
jgi:hypothetical protein